MIRSQRGLHDTEFRKGHHDRNIQARFCAGGFLCLHGFQVLQNRWVRYDWLAIFTARHDENSYCSGVRFFFFRLSWPASYQLIAVFARPIRPVQESTGTREAKWKAATRSKSSAGARRTVRSIGCAPTRGPALGARTGCSGYSGDRTSAASKNAYWPDCRMYRNDGRNTVKNVRGKKKKKMIRNVEKTKNSIKLREIKFK